MSTNSSGYDLVDFLPLLNSCSSSWAGAEIQIVTIVWVVMVLWVSSVLFPVFWSKMWWRSRAMAERSDRDDRLPPPTTWANRARYGCTRCCSWWIVGLVGDNEHRYVIGNSADVAVAHPPHRDLDWGDADDTSTLLGPRGKAQFGREIELTEINAGGRRVASGDGVDDAGRVATTRRKSSWLNWNKTKNKGRSVGAGRLSGIPEDGGCAEPVGPPSDVIERGKRGAKKWAKFLTERNKRKTEAAASAEAGVDPRLLDFVASKYSAGRVETPPPPPPPQQQQQQQHQPTPASIPTPALDTDTGTGTGTDTGHTVEQKSHIPRFKSPITFDPLGEEGGQDDFGFTQGQEHGDEWGKGRGQRRSTFVEPPPVLFVHRRRRSFRGSSDELFTIAGGGGNESAGEEGPELDPAVGMHSRRGRTLLRVREDSSILDAGFINTSPVTPELVLPWEEERLAYYHARVDPHTYIKLIFRIVVEWGADQSFGSIHQRGRVDSYLRIFPNWWVGVLGFGTSVVWQVALLLPCWLPGGVALLWFVPGVVAEHVASHVLSEAATVSRKRLRRARREGKKEKSRLPAPHKSNRAPEAQARFSSAIVSHRTAQVRSENQRLLAEPNRRGSLSSLVVPRLKEHTGTVLRFANEARRSGIDWTRTSSRVLTSGLGVAAVWGVWVAGLAQPKALLFLCVVFAFEAFSRVSRDFLVGCEVVIIAIARARWILQSTAWMRENLPRGAGPAETQPMSFGSPRISGSEPGGGDIALELGSSHSSDPDLDPNLNLNSGSGSGSGSEVLSPEPASRPRLRGRGETRTQPPRRRDPPSRMPPPAVGWVGCPDGVNRAFSTDARSKSAQSARSTNSPSPGMCARVCSWFQALMNHPYQTWFGILVIIGCTLPVLDSSFSDVQFLALVALSSLAPSLSQQLFIARRVPDGNLFHPNWDSEVLEAGIFWRRGMSRKSICNSSALTHTLYAARLVVIPGLVLSTLAALWHLADSRKNQWDAATTIRLRVLVWGWFDVSACWAAAVHLITMWRIACVRGVWRSQK